MNNIISKIAITISVIAMVVSGLAYLGGVKIKDIDTFIGTAPGNMKAEDYMPYVQYNGGYNSAKSITTSDTVTGASLVASGAVTVGTSLSVGTGLDVASG